MSLPTIINVGGELPFDISIVGNVIGIPAQRQYFTLLSLSGLTGSGGVLALEASADASGTTWNSVVATGSISGVASSSVTTDDNYKIPTGAATYFRWRVTTVGTRSIAVFNSGGSQPQDVNVVGGTISGGPGGPASSVTLLAGSATVGAVTQSGGPWSVADATAETLLASLVGGVSTSAKQPALNADGGSYAHVTNFPTAGLGSLTAIPAATTNGTALGSPPAGSRGARLYAPPGASVTFTIAAAAPTSGPTAVITVSNPSGNTVPANWDEDLSGTQMIYVTATTGSPLFRWY